MSNENKVNHHIFGKEGKTVVFPPNILEKVNKIVARYPQGDIM